jgi:hypothetical protein
MLDEDERAGEAVRGITGPDCGRPGLDIDVSVGVDENLGRVRALPDAA